MKEKNIKTSKDFNGAVIAEGDIVKKVDENGIEYVDETTFEPMKFSVDKVKSKEAVIIKDVAYPEAEPEIRKGKLCMKA